MTTLAQYNKWLKEEAIRLEKAFLPFQVNDSVKVSQGFGEKWQPNIYAQFKMKGHNGFDWGMKNLTPIICVAKRAKIVNLGFDGQTKGYGRYVRTLADDGEDVFAHLDRWADLKLGQYVERGQVLGLSDNTGFSTGSHLHYGYRPKGFIYGNGFKGYVDPVPRLQAIYKEENMLNTDELENWAVIKNPGGDSAFVKDGFKYMFGKIDLSNPALHYTFIHNAKFITVDRWDKIPTAKHSAKERLDGKVKDDKPV